MEYKCSEENSGFKEEREKERERKRGIDLRFVFLKTLVWSQGPTTRDELLYIIIGVI